ncbi:MAG: UvrD-helicase domain-containing protein [Thermoguttaceae bacterium]
MPINEYRHEIIRASAGSGKTYQLSERYLKLLLDGVPVESILATTFTRKAAGEIQDRILQRLGEGALSPEGAAKLSAELMNDPGAICQERFRELTVQLVRSINRLRVCTLDSFFMQLAGSFAYELGLPPGWTIVEETENNAILRSAIQMVFAQTDGKNARELSRLLFKGETKKSVESQVFALTSNALEIFNESKRENWLLFKEKSGKSSVSLNECIEELREAEIPEKQKTRFNSARNKILDLLEKKNWQGVLATTLVKCIIKQDYLYYRVSFEELPLKDALEKVVELTIFEQKAALGRQLEAIWKVVEAISFYFNDAKLRKGSYRFDDLAKLLAESDARGRSSEVDYRLDSQTRHLLLDEFQDASFKQWKIVRPFARKIAERSNDSLDPNNPNYGRELSSFFCVGDVKQAIYGWRGGVAEIFQQIENDLPDVLCKSMATNWRSCPTIIETVNEFFLSIEDNPVLDTQKDKDDEVAQQRRGAIKRAVAKWRKNFEEHRYAPRNENLDGFWSLEMAPRFVENSSVADCARKAIVDPTTELEIEPDDHSFEGWNLQAYEDDSDANDSNSESERSTAQDQKDLKFAYAARRIKELRERYPRATIGVLTRSNDFLSKLLRRLKKLGVEASEEGGAPIADSPAVDALLALFRLAAHPGASADAFCVANVEPLAQKLGLDPRQVDATAAKRVSGYLRVLIETKGLGNFASEMRDLLKPACQDKRQKERLDQLVDFAFGYEATSPRSTFDQFVKTAQAHKTQAPSASTVRLMTIHGSKGLEFDIVVLPELDGGRSLGDISRTPFIVGRSSALGEIEGVVKYVGADERAILPDHCKKFFSDEIQRQFEESLCLLYVAITRPKRMLLAIMDPPSGREKPTNLKLTFANLLRFGLQGASPLEEQSPLGNNPQRLVERGECDWGADLKTPVLEDSEKEPASRKREIEERIGPRFQSSGRSRLLYRRESPTDSHKSLVWNRRETFVRGSCIHACFELTRWLDVDGAPTDDTLRRVLTPLALFDKDKVKHVLAEFREMCQTDFVKTLMSRATYVDPNARQNEIFSVVPCALVSAGDLAAPRLEVRREYAYRSLKKDVLESGVIDRLTLLYDGTRLVAADVVDFKSDVHEPNPKLLEEYVEQVKCYEQAIAERFGLPEDKISLRIAFVTLERLVDARTGRILDFKEKNLSAFDPKA